MDSKIEITLKNHESYLHKAIFCGGGIFLLFFLVFLQYSKSPLPLIAFLVLCGIYVAYLFIYFKHPTVVTADAEKLIYKHLYTSVEISLADMDRISCEPYFVNGRYHSEQRIRLTIYTENDELELNDRVDTNEVLNNKLEDKDTDIPLFRLYHFLMKQTGRTE